MTELDRSIKEGIADIVRKDGNYRLRFKKDELKLLNLILPVETCVIRHKKKFPLWYVHNLFKNLYGGYKFDMVVARSPISENIDVIIKSKKSRGLGNKIISYLEKEGKKLDITDVDKEYKNPRV